LSGKGGRVGKITLGDRQWAIGDRKNETSMKGEKSKAILVATDNYSMRRRKIDTTLPQRKKICDDNHLNEINH
jgi:hypothetical protein